jgi:5-methyltetrahydropteroyltriglutamate--homocysteine methyltransferase
MFTATQGMVLPTTVTGSWPRPDWYTLSLDGRPLSRAMIDLAFREQFTDAVSCVISDQERAGLNILTNGDYHLDKNLAGESWLLYPVERLGGFARVYEQPSGEWAYPAGTIMHEIFGGWRYPPVVDKVGAGIPFEFDKAWRIAQSRTTRPVKFGTVSADVAGSVVEIRTSQYDDDKRQLMWDMATVMNQELRTLATAGCKVIQLEEPLVHFIAHTAYDQEYIDFLVDCFNHQVSDLGDVEIWVHTCWGNPNMQQVLHDTTYEKSIETYLDRVHCDVWTVEMKDRDYRDLDLFKPWKGHMKKKVAIGVISHRRLQVEAADEVARDIRTILQYIDPENLVLTTDCGFGRQGCNRLIAFYKATSLCQGTNIVRRELGAAETPVPALDAGLQIDSTKHERKVAITTTF